MVHGTIQLVDARGRKYLTREERERFLAAAAREGKPDRQTFALTLAHSGARLSEVLALRPADIDLDASAIRIRTLKRRAEHWREGTAAQRGAPSPRARPRAPCDPPATRRRPAMALVQGNRTQTHRRRHGTRRDLRTAGMPQGAAPLLWNHRRLGRRSTPHDRRSPRPRRHLDDSHLHHSRRTRGTRVSRSHVDIRPIQYCYTRTCTMRPVLVLAALFFASPAFAHPTHPPSPAITGNGLSTQVLFVGADRGQSSLTVSARITNTADTPAYLAIVGPAPLALDNKGGVHYVREIVGIAKCQTLDNSKIDDCIANQNDILPGTTFTLLPPRCQRSSTSNSRPGTFNRTPWSVSS